MIEVDAVGRCRGFEIFAADHLADADRPPLRALRRAAARRPGAHARRGGSALARSGCAAAARSRSHREPRSRRPSLRRPPEPRDPWTSRGDADELACTHWRLQSTSPRASPARTTTPRLLRRRRAVSRRPTSVPTATAAVPFENAFLSSDVFDADGRVRAGRASSPTAKPRRWRASTSCGGPAARRRSSGPPFANAATRNERFNAAWRPATGRDWQGSWHAISASSTAAACCSSSSTGTGGSS